MLIKINARFKIKLSNHIIKVAHIHEKSKMALLAALFDCVECLQFKFYDVTKSWKSSENWSVLGFRWENPERWSAHEI